MKTRIKIESYEEQLDQQGYVKEVNKVDVYEQVFETSDIDVREIVKMLNSFPD